MSESDEKHLADIRGGLKVTSPRGVFLVDVVWLLALIERLQGENTTLRNAQKSCEDCGGPTKAEFEQVQAELARAQSTARDMRPTWEFGAKVMGKLVIPRAHQMSPGEIPFEFLERFFTQVEQLQAQLAECQAARARLSDPVVESKNQDWV